MTEIHVSQGEPFRDGRTVILLTFRYDPDTVAAVKGALSRARGGGRPVGGWLPEHRVWFIEPTAWPAVRDSLARAGWTFPGPANVPPGRSQMEYVPPTGDGGYEDYALWRIHCEVFGDESGGEMVVYAVTDDAGHFPDAKRVCATNRSVEVLHSITLYALVKDPRKFDLPRDANDDLYDQTTCGVMT
jgi:hypothetical protein